MKSFLRRIHHYVPSLKYSSSYKNVCSGDGRTTNGETMWRRTYILLLLVRIFFALRPSYIHPDENFQGPEVLAGRIFSYPSLLTWEFTSENPIRSIFPLWFIYGLPMTLLKWLWAESGNGNPPPQLIFYVLRGTMFLLSLVLEDWAIYELLSSPQRRRQAVVLVASSYVTWTYQTHTFSNSLETVLVAWALVLIQRIKDNKHKSSAFNCMRLALIAVIGLFNRITFPGFFLIPAIQLIPHFRRKPVSLLTILASGLVFSFLAVAIDTGFYNPKATFTDLLRKPIITPLNNLMYNSDSSNLALHGIHPRYQHFTVNLAQLLGPVYILLIWSLVTKGTNSAMFSLRNIRAYAALSGTAALSIFPHQEARFIMPSIPLILTCFNPPRSRIFLASWIIFNGLLGILMGSYHQGGVFPTQIAMPSILTQSIPKAQVSDPQPIATVLWWKAYSPPLWLFGDSKTDFKVETHDLKGMSRPDFQQQLEESIQGCHPEKQPVVLQDDGIPKIQIQGNLTFLVAPHSNPFIDQFVAIDKVNAGLIPDDRIHQDPIKFSTSLRLRKIYKYDTHVNMDDFDPLEDGLFGAVWQVLGRKGLIVWLVTRECEPVSPQHVPRRIAKTTTM